MPHDDEYFMEQALKELSKGVEQDDLPFGAVVVLDGRVIGRGHNRLKSTFDPTADAEIVALRDAGMNLGAFRLSGATLYSTWEPCIMCLGAIMNAGVSRLVLGGRNRSERGPSDIPYAEAPIDELVNLARFAGRITITTGVLQERCERALSDWGSGTRP